MGDLSMSKSLFRTTFWVKDAPPVIAPRLRLYDDAQTQPDVSHTMGKKSWADDAPPAMAPRLRLYDDEQTQAPPAMGDLMGVPRDEESHGYRATLPRVRWVSFSFAADQRLLGSAWYGVWIHNWKAILIGSGIPYKKNAENITQFLLRRQDDCALAIQVRSSIDAGILSSNRILTCATTASEIFNKLPGFKLPEYHDRQPGVGAVRYTSCDLILCVDWAEGLTPRQTGGWSRFGMVVRGRYHTGPEMTLFEGS